MGEWIAALGGWIVAIAVSYFSYTQKAQETFLRGLEWLDGGTQRRSLGLATIEERWGSRGREAHRFRRATVPILINTAIYLLLESKQGDSAHERHNLDRVMHMLLDRGPLTDMERRYYVELADSIERAVNRAEVSTPGHGTRGLTVPVMNLTTWHDRASELVTRSVARRRRRRRRPC